MQLGRATGLALLESLMAMVLLCIGSLSLVWSHQHIMRLQRQQTNRETAMRVAQNLAQRMQINPAQRQLYARSWGGADLSVPTPCDSSPCDAAALAAWDLQVTTQELLALPLGDLAVFPAFADIWGLSIAWHDTQETFRTDDAWASPSCPVNKSCWRFFFTP